jgi:amino acid adenylation domain-containing protein/non-ribosomal peptide synthase protein (TIGR01720 family)
MYKTGDLGRWLPDGTVEFLGRKDDQVKIRGYRIELGEIDNTLKEHADVDNAIVLARATTTGEKELVAYVVSKNPLSKGDLQTYLSRSLPSYMLPGQYVFLPELPLTPNGKIDRKKLPDPQTHGTLSGKTYIAPRTETEQKLVLIWQEVLGREMIGMKDDFFELGGHSLKATRLASQIHKSFEVKIDFTELFTKTMLEEQAELIDQAQKTSFVTIPVAETKANYPLSSSQHRLWILSQFEGGNIAYNVPGVYILEGALDTVALSASFDALVARHEILRTVFTEDDNGGIKQFIKTPEETGFKITSQDLREEKEQEEKIRDLVQAVVNKPFDLSAGPLMQANLYQVANNKWIFIFNMHHIISDGWSKDILMKELSLFYNAHCTGSFNSLSPLRIHYKDYAVWQQEQLSGEVLNVHKDYWLKQFAGELPVLELPVDKVRPATRSYKGGVINKVIDPQSGKGLKALNHEEGVTLFMGLLAAVNTLLYRYTNQENIIIGSPVAGREHVDLEGQIGFYVNTLALKTQCKGTDSYRTLLQHVKQVSLEAYAHQAYPFDELVKELDLQRDMSRHPLFDVMVQLQNNNNAEGNNLREVKISRYAAVTEVISKFDLLFSFTEREEAIEVSIEYNSDIYHSSTIDRMGDHLLQLVEAIVAQPSIPIWQVAYLREQEKHQLLLAGYDEQVDYPKDKTITNLFEEQASRTPNNVAIVFEETGITYKELNEKANQLAHYLRDHYAIQPDDLVGIKLERGEWMIISILGILKAGGAYVPIDPAYPQERIDFMQSDSNCKVVIDEQELERFRKEESRHDKENPVSMNKPSDLAYVIYTSGTTGHPKGSLITHNNVVRLFKTDKALFEFTASDVWTLFHSYCFDFSVWEMFGALLYGGKLIIVPYLTSRDPGAYLELLNREGVTVLNQTPSAFYNLLKHEFDKEGASLHIRYVIFGGEALSPGKLAEWKQRYPATQLINMYGITETTVHVTYKEITEKEIGENISNIGKPIPTLSCYVLDDQKNMVPAGVWGELYVGGEGVCRGYLNREDLSRQRFISSPFREGERLYRSGDKVRLLGNGEMEYGGRIDDQVKIRGYRIELGEIEGALQSHQDIDTAVVLAKTNKDGEKELVAYVVSKGTLNISAIRSYLGNMLPAYMLPAHYVQVDALPLTHNGKVNRKKLPEPDGIAMETGVTYVAPQNAIERDLVAIYEEVLKKQPIGIKDNFFDLGGDSIKVLRIISEIRKIINSKVSIADIYKHNTIENLVQHVVQNNDHIYKEQEAIVVAQLNDLRERILLSPNIPDKDNIEDIYPMSDIEKGMVYESLIIKDAGIYHDQFVNQAVFVDFNIVRFRQALQLLADKHSILRTGFNLNDFEREVQIVYKQIAICVPCKDMANFTRQQQQQELQNFSLAELRKPFNVSAAPLWRANIFTLSKDEIVFIFQFHHAILDGWSHASFITELNNLYLKLGEDPFYKPQKLKSGYKDFIVQHGVDKNNRSSYDFWKKELSQCKRLDLFTDGYAYSNYAQTADTDFSGKLKKAAVDLNSTVKILSLSAYLYMLKVLNYDGELITGVVTNTRPAIEDGDKVLGCFLNTIPVRISLNDNTTCRDLVSQVHNKLIELKDHEWVSLLEISRMHHDVQSGSGKPLFDTFFNYVDFHTYGSLTADRASMENEVSSAIGNISRARTNVPLEVSINVTGDGYSARFNLSRKLKSGLSAEKLAKLYFNVLASIIHSPDRAIQDIDYLHTEEKHQLLVNFNNTTVDFPANKTLTGLFEEQVTKAPDNTALVFNGKEFTFRELNEQSNQLAHYLKQHYNIQPDNLIGIKLERSEWMIISILAVLKCGGAYVPIDPEYPQERISYLVTDSNCKVLIDEQELSKFQKEKKKYEKKNLPVTNKPTDLAYVIYTSGSTGKPKGCMLEHRGVINRLEWQYRHYTYSPEDIILQKTTFTFDVSVWEIFIPLCRGLKMVLCNKDDVGSPARIASLISTQKVTCLHFVPSMLNAFMIALQEDENAGKSLSSLRLVVTSGEALPVEYVKSWYKSFQVPIHNLYGPTEASVDVTCYTTSEQDNIIPIGRPIWNTQIYIVGKANQLLPLGVAGEICIGGIGLARGYWNKPELTAQKFVNNPFKEGERMYRTGDLGRWLPDGNIAYLGRIDDQVKIRGFRIELGEIEAMLLQSAMVNQAAVIVKEATEHKYLVAYVVAREGYEQDRLKEYLKAQLPDYMIPSAVVELPELPLTPNGKVNRKALAGLDSPLVSAEQYVAPRNKTEEKITGIWKEILNVEQIGVNDNFFMLGGDSIISIRVVSRIKQAFNKSVELRQFYQLATVAALAKYIEDDSPQHSKKDILRLEVIDQLEKLKEDVYSALPDASAIEDVYPMSDIQKGMVFEQLKDQGNGVYHDQFVYQIPLVDVNVFKKAFSLLVEKHTMLRTAFDVVNFIGKDLQIVYKTVPVHIHVEELLYKDPVSQQAYIQAFVEEERKKPFTIEAAPLWRLAIFQTAADRMVYIFQFHHAILDGWSVASLNTELHHLYLTLKEDPTHIPLRLLADYKTGIITSQIEKADEENVVFWKNELSEYKRLAIFENEAFSSGYEKSYSKEYLHQLQTICTQYGIPLKTMFLGAYLYSLGLLTDETDITVGLVSNTRPVCEDGDKILGCFLNSIPFRHNKAAAGSTWLDYIKEVDQKVTALKGRDQLSLYEINRLTGGDARESNPFFDVLFNFINFHIYDQLQVVEGKSGNDNRLDLNSFETTNTYLDVSVSVTGGTLKIIYKQRKRLQSGISLEEFSEYFERTLNCIALKPSGYIDNREILPEETLRQLLAYSGDTVADDVGNRSIVEWFGAQVEKTPDNIALVVENEELTYRELNEQSNRFGHYLRENYQVQPGSLVGVQLNRSSQMIIVILGVLKSGAAYVPIDPVYPQERIDYIIADSQCRVVIDEPEWMKFSMAEKKYSSRDLQPGNTPHDLAYVIYTSGSTGKPKGVMIEHRNVNAFIHWCHQEFDHSVFDVVFAGTSICFDLSIFEIFYPLTIGKKIRLLPNGLSIGNYLHTSENILLNTVPSVVGALLSEGVDLSAVTVLNMAGEPIPAKYLAHLDCDRIEIRNLYGPSEDTTYSTCYHISKNAKILIGRPISNTRIYILNKDMQLQPPGVAGEICISGCGLARGYLNQPELTAARFVPNPFVEGERMYKTGDIARWLPDGNIEFIGRKDDQVKIRGYRIELGEIENALRKFSTIDEAIVVARPNQEENMELVAYVISKEVVNIPHLRNYLSGVLPAYMLPGNYIQLEALPLTANGKIDKKRLPDPSISRMETGIPYIAPGNIREQNLVAVFEEVLKKQPIGIKEDFFVLGGDSIKSIQVVARLRQRGFLLTIQDVLRYPVIEQLAERVQGISRLADQGLTEGMVPLSPVQAWFFEQALVDSHHFNQSVLLYSRDSLSEEALQASLDTIMLHHDALRMVYYEKSEGWVQENKGKEQRCVLQVFEYTNAAQFAMQCEEMQSGIDLSAGPLFNAALFHGVDGDRLLLVAHHLVIDGVSWRILFDDLLGLYQQHATGKTYQLPQKTDSFKYWQEKQVAYAGSESLQKEAPYWLAIESLPISPLSTDNAQGSNLIKDGASASFTLDEAITNRLLTQCYKAYGTEVNDILLGAFSMAIADLFGMEKVAINLEAHGREDIGASVDVTRTVGWFTTMYPVVFDMRYREDSLRHLVEVKETLHRVPNKGIGYGILRYLLGKDYRLTPAITFNYLGDFGSGVKTEQGEQIFEFSREDRGRSISPLAQRNAVLDVTGMITENRLQLSISYSAKQYTKNTIDRLLVCFREQLEGLIIRLSEEEKIHLTPVDLTYKGLRVEQVTALNQDHLLEDVYPLSPLQEGLYYHWLSYPHSLAYHEQMSYRIKGALDIGALEKSYEQLVLRHSVLRTCFTQELGQSILQVVKRSVGSNFKYFDISEATDFSIDEYKESNRVRGFDLHSGSQMSLTIFGLGNNEYEFIWSYHHILMDGWCVGILIRECFEIYNSLVQGSAPAMKEVHPYSSYIEWLMRRNKELSIQYWSDYLRGYDTISEVPKKITPSKDHYEWQESAISLEGSIWQSISSLCSDLGVTENVFIQTVWGILLARYNSTNDVVFGSVVSGRPGEIQGIEEMIGLFINTVPVRIRVKEGASIITLLKEVQQRAIEGSAHHYTQLAEVQSVSELGGTVFDHIMIFENYPVQEMVAQQMTASTLSLLSSSGFEQTHYDLTVIIIPGEKISIRFEYNSNVYDELIIKGVQEHVMRLIEEIVKKPGTAIDEIDYLNEEEKHRLSVICNDTAVAYPEHKTIVELFEEQVARTPHNMAVVFEGTELTYAALNESANRLANYLRQHYNVQPDDLIGIKLERSEWMIISILGILKSGGAYVPVDPEYPQERIDYMIADSSCKVVIDEQELTKFRAEANTYGKDDTGSISKPANLAYVIYTSGTTGRPKGVMIEHRSLLDYSITFSVHFHLQESDRLIQQATFSFDTHVEEIYPALITGGCILMGKGGGRDVQELNGLIQQKNATVLSTTPLVLRELNSISNNVNQLRIIISGGDRFNGAFTANYIGKTTIYDSYGPSESTVCSTYAKIDRIADVSIIGKPIANRSIYILNGRLQLQPVGVVGEIFIGGAGLARGYLNNPLLTAEKFIANPFKQGERIYRTGDLGRWLPDGTIEFIGRRDEQVKIRGYRIEPGEIENVLQSYQNIDAAVVMAKQNQEGESELVAYLVSKEMLKIFDLRTYLASSLPRYMIPTHFIQLDQLPLTANGKIDKKRLPDPTGAGIETGVEYIAPRNAIEEKLTLIWQEILGKEKIGIKDNFFDLGGHSLKATRLASLVQREFDVKVALKDVFSNPTIEYVSDIIRANKWIENSRRIKDENRDIIEL